MLVLQPYLLHKPPKFAKHLVYFYCNAWSEYKYFGSIYTFFLSSLEMLYIVVAATLYIGIINVPISFDATLIMAI